MAEIKSLLDDVIEKEIGNIESLPSGEEKSSAIRDLSTLHKLRIEEIKAQTEMDEKRERRKMDSEQHQADLALKTREADGKDTDRAREETIQKHQARDQVIDRRVRTGIQVAELVLPLAFYGIWMGMGFAFELDNSFTSTTFKNLLNRFKPTKRG